MSRLGTQLCREGLYEVGNHASPVSGPLHSSFMPLPSSWLRETPEGASTRLLTVARMMLPWFCAGEMGRRPNYFTENVTARNAAAQWD